MHIGFATYAGGAALGPKAHIPSGRVLVEDIIKFAIEELGVKPLRGKDHQWRKVIAKARDAVMKFKSW